MKLNFAFVPFPREIWTDVIDLSQAEFRLLGWFCCNLKFGVQQPVFSDEQIMRGCQLDGLSYPPCGLARNSLKRARAMLQDRGFLNSEQVTGGGGRSSQATWRYSLNLSEVDKFPEKPVKDGHQSCQRLTPEVSTADTYKGIEETETTDLTLCPPTSDATPPKKKEPKADPRYPEFIEALSSGYKRRGWEFSFAGPDGKQLKALLTRFPRMTVNEFRLCLKNYFASEKVVPGDMPYTYLNRLPRYKAGPLNEFGKLLAPKVEMVEDTTHYA